MISSFRFLPYEIPSQNKHLSAEGVKQGAIADLRELIGQQKIGDGINLLVLKQQGNIMHNLRSTAVKPIAAIWGLVAKHRISSRISSSADVSYSGSHQHEVQPLL